MVVRSIHMSVGIHDPAVSADGSRGTDQRHPAPPESCFQRTWPVLASNDTSTGGWRARPALPESAANAHAQEEPDKTTTTATARRSDNGEHAEKGVPARPCTPNNLLPMRTEVP